jgi:hypothetical protein
MKTLPFIILLAMLACSSEDQDESEQSDTGQGSDAIEPSDSGKNIKTSTEEESRADADTEQQIVEQDNFEDSDSSPTIINTLDGGPLETSTDENETSTEETNSGETNTEAEDSGTRPITEYDNQTLMPHSSWDCGMPDGIPPPEMGTVVFQAELNLGEIYDMGTTQYGHRHLTEIEGGTVTGSKINGRVLTGGLDWQLTLPNGAVEIEQVNILMTNDRVPIYFRNCGTSPSADLPERFVPDFEAPNSSRYAWLNSGAFVGIRKLDMSQKTMTLTLYDISKITPPTDTVEVIEPEDLPNQVWQCPKSSGRNGAVVYTETVRIGSSISVGNSKRGSRNIIPITGGTTRGRIQGKVLPGGADFQLTAGTRFTIDARYTLRTNDGELIIVRNCGALGGLVPLFETRLDGPYAWIDSGIYRSSNPGVGVGSVNITIYEKQ